MPKRTRFTLCFAPETVEHLDRIETKYHSALQRSIAEQLTWTPATETRNRKPLDQPAPLAATWELRCGPQNRFRVLYDVDLASHEVYVLAIGVKRGSRLVIGTEEFES